MKIMTILGNGFEELEAIGTIDILKRGDIQVDIYALENTSSKGRSDITVNNLLSFNTCNPKEYDGLLLGGGAHYQLLEANDKVKDIIFYFHKENKIIAAICAAPTILGHMGLLKDRNYTCYTSMNEDFGGIFHDQSVVSDNTLITARSAASTIEFGFAILSLLTNNSIVTKVKEDLYY